jgi:Flp pilus assembly protein TadG
MTDRKARHRLARGMRGEQGGAFVEMALLLPVLTLLLVGAGEFGRLAYYAIEVASAAHAGAQYGAESHITAANTSAIQSAAASDAVNLTQVATLTTTVTTSCVCSSGAAITCATAATCTARIIEYVQVNTSAPVSTLFTYPGLPTSYTLKGAATMRVEQ